MVKVQVDKVSLGWQRVETRSGELLPQIVAAGFVFLLAVFYKKLILQCNQGCFFGDSVD